MPTTHNTSDETSYPDYSQYDKDNSTTKPLPSKPQQSESRSAAATTTGRPPHHDSQDAKPHTGGRGSRNGSSDALSSEITTRPITTSDETPQPDHSQLDRDNSTTKHLPTNLQQSEGRSTATTTTTTTTGRLRHDSQGAKPHTGGRGSKRGPLDSFSGSTTTAIRSNRPSNASLTDHQKPRSGNGNNNRGSASDGDSSDSHDLGVPRNQEHDIPTSNAGRSNLTRYQLNSQSPSFAQAAQQAPRTSKDLQQPQGATEDPSVKGGHPSAREHPRKLQDAQVPPGHHSEDGHQDRTAENKQSQAMAQVPGYGRGGVTGVVGAAVDSIMSFMPTVGPPPPKDKYQQLKEEYYRIRDENKQLHAVLENYDRELRRRNGDLSKANHFTNHLQHELQRSRDTINGFQNELNNVHHQLEDAKTLSEVRGKELVGAQVFLTKADTLSISEVGEKLTALNEELFQAAATLGEALIHKRHEVPQKELEVAAAMAQEMVGEKMTKILIAQAQKQELEVNPLLVQVVLQMFMVNFCVTKIKSWYPGDEAIGDFLSTIYYEIRSTGKGIRIDFKNRVLPDIKIIFFRGTSGFRSMACSYSCPHQTQH